MPEIEKAGGPEAVIAPVRPPKKSVWGDYDAIANALMERWQARWASP